MKYTILSLAFVILTFFELNAQITERFSFTVAPDVTSESSALGVFVISTSEDAFYNLEMSFLNKQTNVSVGESVKFKGDFNSSELTNLYWNGRDGKGSPIELGVFLKVKLSITSKIDSQKHEVLNYTLPFNKTLDSDQDGILNHKDKDADNDGIANYQEYFNNDPFVDSDKDGIPNYVDVDFISANGEIFIDVNRDGINDLFDTDRDGVLNDQDIDANDDGVLDIFHSKLDDIDDNGRIDNWMDLNDDGLLDDLESSAVELLNHDDDVLPDVFDKDADNDGLSNNLECQVTNNIRLASGFDGDLNGLLDMYDGQHGGHSLNGIDLDKNGVPDMFEKNADGIAYGKDICNAEYKITSMDIYMNCTSSIDPKKCVQLSIENEISAEEKEVVLQWNMGDGTLLEGRSIEHCYNEQGNYVVSLNVLDATDRSIIQSEEIQTEVVTLNGYSIDIISDNKAKINESISFDYATLFMPGYILTELIWDFGDGEYSCDYQNSHSYNVPGSYTVATYATIKSKTSTFVVCDKKTILISK
ncbi:MAG: PKD domain-containing protein [Salibacteraceae bacterium]